VPQTIALQRLLGTPTAWLLGMGVAIGSGIFRTPGDIAAALPAPGWILAAWLAGGLVVLAQGLVSSELATRFPKAGGEYVYLREAYGEFAAFFFGWAYTLFIIGGGAALIAAALGDFAVELFSLARGWSHVFAAGALGAVVLVNALGLRAGAGTQNMLTALKIVALLALVVCGLIMGKSWPDLAASLPPASDKSVLSLLLIAMLSALWSYDGTTDAVKMAEEVKDPRRALPRAIIGSTLSLIVIYALVNLALLRIVPADEMAGLSSVPGEAMARLFGEGGRRATLVVAILVCLGALSSTFLATVRVTFALARDGLAPRVLARMSDRQAPVATLFVVGGFSIALALWKRFDQVLEIYFLVSALLFGLSYASLIVFRLREKRFPETAFRCPGGPFLAGALIAFQLLLAWNIASAQWHKDESSALWTLAFLASFGIGYLVWKRLAPSET
jgi:APA family basic amino acid/polyamine antiporter